MILTLVLGYIEVWAVDIYRLLLECDLTLPYPFHIAHPLHLFTTASDVTSGTHVLMRLCPVFNLIEPEQQ